MEAVILAAGRGSRFGALTADIPKPMLRLAGVPIIERLMVEATYAGVERFYVCVGYLGERIIEHLGDGERLGVHIEYCRQKAATPESAFMAGLEQVRGDAFLCLCGDTFIRREALSSFVGRFYARNADALFALDTGNESNTIRVELDRASGGRILGPSDRPDAWPIAYDMIMKTSAARLFNARSPFTRQMDGLADKLRLEATEIPMTNMNTAAEYEAMNALFESGAV